MGLAVKRGCNVSVGLHPRGDALGTGNQRGTQCPLGVTDTVGGQSGRDCQYALAVAYTFCNQLASGDEG